MTVDVLGALCAGAFLVALATSGVLRVAAERRGLVDRPNERSLHTKPVPRLGGVGIVLGATSATVVAMLADRTHGKVLVPWLVAALALAALGLVDDVRGLGAGARMLAHLTISGGFVAAVGVPPAIELVAGVALPLPPVVSAVAWTVFITGVLNIYNFMDGMDGLAASQAVGAALATAAAFAALVAGSSALVFVVPAVLAAATGAFFVHNAPPAKIFMGDAGSTFVGFTFAALALLGTMGDAHLPALTVPVALAPFLLDGTFTIFRRLSKGEKIWRAHRSHLYQRAVATGLGHHDVLVRYVAWVGVSAGAALVVAARGEAVAACAIAVAVGGLVSTVLWVRGLERSRPSEAPTPPA